MPLTKGVLTWIKDPKQKDYDHVIPKLEDAITCLNHTLSIHHKPNDKFVPLFPQSIELQYILFEIIDISNQTELNSLRNAVKNLALKPDAVDQWNQALVAVNTIYNRHTNILFVIVMPSYKQMWSYSYKKSR